jgi:hypothetical protein
MDATKGGGTDVGLAGTVGGDAEDAGGVGDELTAGVVDCEGVGLVVAGTDGRRSGCDGN